ncbi:MAG: endonuclease III domain-containing protein [Candidatus Dadabacteria bacterium]|nr:endonuclease III domain-containing protein [Candidatus Dadabacteria bacterium]NIQ13188.1 endonuclease III domain-containing protein [Candidatus Dadabacteria bacterium]
MKNENKIKQFYNILFKHYGPQNWWPGESIIECIIGAILTQNTSWVNVEKAIKNLKDNSLLNVEKLNFLSANEIAEFIKPSGFYNQKAKTLKNFINFLTTEYDQNLDIMLHEDTKILREKLLRIKGIGPETADSILLYGLNKPSFVIDKYTYRILNRHKLIPQQTNYYEMQNLIIDNIDRDTYIYNEFHALIVKVGKEHCKSRAICRNCPLEFDL